jgi:hypothetical protein
MNHRSSRTEHSLLAQLTRGVAAGILGGVAMNAFARACAALTHGAEAAGAAPGADRTGRGVQPPQSEGTAEDDAAVQVGTMAYRAATGDEPRSSDRHLLGTAAHYAFSVTAGVGYAVLVPYAPVLRRGYGTLYGTLVWALADEGVVPALGLSRTPSRLPLGVHLYALCGHLVYGATVAAVMREERRGG